MVPRHIKTTSAFFSCYKKLPVQSRGERSSEHYIDLTRRFRSNDSCRRVDRPDDDARSPSNTCHVIILSAPHICLPAAFERDIFHANSIQHNFKAHAKSVRNKRDRREKNPLWDAWVNANIEINGY
jgi:hypothetical protein